MNMRSGFAVALVAGAAVGVAWAGPRPESDQHRRVVKAPWNGGSGGVTDGPGFTENFDSYLVGSGVAGQGGWQFWDGASANALVDNTTSASGLNSAVAVVNTDIVQLFNITSGQWVAKVKTFMPSGGSGIGYFIMLDQFTLPYVPSQTHWAVEVHFNRGLGAVISQNRPAPAGPGPTQVPLIVDQWVELVINIDLDTDSMSMTYGGQTLATNLQWSHNASNSPGLTQIQCIDLYSTVAGFRWDDISLQPAAAPCYANCDSSTTAPILNVADFTCFLQKFAAGDAYANCDASTTPPVLNVADFTCFLQKFAAGCQ